MLSIIKNNKNINKIINKIKKYYKKVFNDNFHNVKIYVSDNINEDTKLFLDIKNLEFLPKLSGRYIEPNNLSSTATILINYELFFQPGYSFIGTILHELTHASDLKKFNKEYCNNNWSILKDNSNFKIMHLWSEYHARVVEIVHMRIVAAILYPNIYIYNIEKIKDEMTNWQLINYNNELINLINSNKVTLEEIFIYCARLYVCELYNPMLLLEDIIPKKLYEVFPDIEQLYCQLKQLQNYKDMSKSFDKLKNFLSDFKR